MFLSCFHVVVLYFEGSSMFRLHRRIGCVAGLPVGLRPLPRPWTTRSSYHISLVGWRAPKILCITIHPKIGLAYQVDRIAKPSSWDPAHPNDSRQSASGKALRVILLMNPCRLQIPGLATSGDTGADRWRKYGTSLVVVIRRAMHLCVRFACG